jgi:hypothetical protein
MRTRSRRWLDRGLIVAGTGAVGGAAFMGALFGNVEEVDAVWNRAVLAPTGEAQVLEVIDWDFGAAASDRHGIYRVIPGVGPDTPMAVTADAPDQVEATAEGDRTRFRIGDPAQTVTGKHRYELSYPLPGVTRDGVVDWEAVGTEWEVGTARAEVHLLAPYELVEPRCFVGRAGSGNACAVDEVAPGHLVARSDGLGAGEGLSIEARQGDALPAVPPVPDPPTDRPTEAGAGLAKPFGVGLAAAGLAAVPTSMLVRRAGRERVSSSAGGAADVAYQGVGAPGAGPPVDGVGTIGRPVAGGPSWLPEGDVRVDEDELAAMVTTEFAPPAELTPAQGGIVLVESVQPEHKVAWLVQAAIDGAVHLEEDDDHDVTGITRLAPGGADVRPILDAAFDDRQHVPLGTYDEHFGRAWGELGEQLEHWRRECGLWDGRADRRRAWVRGLGVVGFVVGEGVVVLGGVLASMFGAAWLGLVLAGAVLAGVSLAAVIRGWELRVRTPAGSGLWLRVESFRRFLAGSEAWHAEEAAKRGVLREYTAWALALGEIDRWSRAVQASPNIASGDAGLAYAYMAPSLLASTHSASTAPSSGGGGGFGGGSVGGGAGGGGGGSW